jgi:hypothetical protein
MQGGFYTALPANGACELLHTYAHETQREFLQSTRNQALSTLPHFWSDIYGLFFWNSIYILFVCVCLQTCGGLFRDVNNSVVAVESRDIKWIRSLFVNFKNTFAEPKMKTQMRILAHNLHLGRLECHSNGGFANQLEWALWWMSSALFFYLFIFLFINSHVHTLFG